MARMGSTTSARAQEMRRLLQRWERSGQTIVEFEKRHGLSRNTLSWWRYVFRRAAEQGAPTPPRTRRRRRRSRRSPRFVELKVPVRATTAPERGVPFEVVVDGGTTVRVAIGFDAAELGRLLGVLRSC